MYKQKVNGETKGINKSQQVGRDIQLLQSINLKTGSVVPWQPLDPTRGRGSGSPSDLTVDWGSEGKGREGRRGIGGEARVPARRGGTGGRLLALSGGGGGAAVAEERKTEGGGESNPIPIQIHGRPWRCVRRRFLPWVSRVPHGPTTPPARNGTERHLPPCLGLGRLLGPLLRPNNTVNRSRQISFPGPMMRLAFDPDKKTRR